MANGESSSKEGKFFLYSIRPLKPKSLGLFLFGTVTFVTKSRTDFEFSDFPGEKQDSTGPSSKRPKLDAAEVKAMSAKQYMDELIVPTLLKGLSACNKQVRSQFIERRKKYIRKN